MAIFRDKAALVKAATGVEPTPKPTPIQTPLGQAMTSKLMPAPGYGEFMKQAALTTPPMTSTLGLSPEGKYGGFYTAGDLDKAIQGEAMARNQELLDYAASLRELAAKQRGQVGQQVGERIRQAQGTESFMGPVGPGKSPEAQSAQAYGTRRMAELAQGDVLASQIEETPMSQLARAIATRKYGVNPALAAGMYGPQYDIEAGKQQRDIYYYEPGKVFGYEDYLAQEKQKQQDVANLISEAKTSQDVASLQAAFPYSKDVQDLYYTQQASGPLKMNAAKLFSAAQVTPEQGYNLVTQPINVDGQPVTFTALADDAFQQIQDDNVEGAFAAADALMGNPETRMLGRLLATYVDSIAKAYGKAGRSLYQYQQTSDILGP